MAGFADEMGGLPGIGAAGLPGPGAPPGGGMAPGGAKGGSQDPLNVLRMLARHGKRRGKKKAGKKKKG